MLWADEGWITQKGVREHKAVTVRALGTAILGVPAGGGTRVVECGVLKA